MRLALALAIAGLAAPGGQAAQDDGPPAVVASIKPLHSLAAAVMGQEGRPALLIEGTGSPHTYNLRPSQAVALAEAELVVWFGPQLEGFLLRPLASLAGDASKFAAIDAPGVEVLSARSGGLWEDHGGHGHGHEHEHVQVNQDGDAGHGDDPAGRTDPHVWLDPHNAIAIVHAIAEELAALDPARAAAYRANAAAYAERLRVLDGRLRARLKPLRGQAYLVFHDGYQYFERHYGLSAAGAVSVSAGRAPGVRRVLEMERRIRQGDVICLFAEPQFPPALVESLASDTGIRHGVLDPIGIDLPAGADAYPEMMERLAASFADCLAGN